MSSSSSPAKTNFTNLSIRKAKGKGKSPVNESSISPEPAEYYTGTSGSETEGPQSTKMSARRSDKYYESSNASSSKSKSSSKSTSKSPSNSSSKSPSKKDDWSEVAEPDERRRIQNRIAQRKFREKAKESKEAAVLASENQARAGYSYETPQSGSMNHYDEELSGLPWGGVSVRYAIERGTSRESGSARGRGSGSYGGSYQGDNQDPYLDPRYYEYGSRGGSGSGSGSGSGRGSSSR